MHCLRSALSLSHLSSLVLFISLQARASPMTRIALETAPAVRSLDAPAAALGTGFDILPASLAAAPVGGRTTAVKKIVIDDKPGLTAAVAAARGNSSAAFDGNFPEPSLQDPAAVPLPTKSMPSRRNDMRLAGGARLLTGLTAAQVAEIRARSGAIDHYLKDGRPVRRNMRVASDGGKLAVKADEIFVVTHTRFEIMDKRLRLLPSLLRLAKKRHREGRDLVLIDWGAGEGRTLVTLKDELERRGITNVQYYGYSVQYFPQWEKLPAGIGMILDVPENIFRHVPAPVDVVYSHYALDLMINTRSRSLERHDPAHFALLRGMLAPDGEIRNTNIALPLDKIRALGFKAVKIPVDENVWNKSEREVWKMTSYRFTPGRPEL